MSKKIKKTQLELVKIKNKEENNIKKNSSTTKINHWKLWTESKVVKKKDKTATLKENNQAFFNSLPKITEAGFRAPIALGTNTFNHYNIKVIMIAFVKLMQIKPHTKIIIFHDQRKESKTTSQKISQILENWKIKTYFFHENSVAPTPFLSYLLKQNNSIYQYGIMITASHNKKEINGLKIMNHQGELWKKENWNALNQLIKKEYWNFLNYSLKKTETTTETLSEKNKTEYLAKIQKLLKNNDHPKRKIKIMFSSLHGTTIGWTDLLLKQSGYKVSLVPQQCRINANFITVEDPNPENNDVFDIALKACKKENIDLIIVNDCDGDRMRVACKINEKNEFYLFSGNEIAIIFTFFLLQEKKRHGYLYRSFVSNGLVDKIAKDFNTKVLTSNSGFNNIAGKFIKEGEELFVLAFEEALGFLPDLRINRFKDGLQAALLISEIAEFCQKKEKTLWEYLENIYQKYGYAKHQTFRHDLTKIDLTTLEKKLKQINMINGEKIIEKKIGVNPRYYLLRLNNAEIALRFSQTEPIMKIYFNVYDIKEKASSQLNEIIYDFYKLLEIKGIK